MAQRKYRKSEGNAELRIMLAVPPRPVVQGREVGASNNSPAMGLAYIAAELIERGRRVVVMDADAERLLPAEIEKRIAEFRPDVFGAGAYTSEIKRAHEMARAARRANEKVLNLIGGFHASALPTETLEEFPAFDVAVYGEGERAVSSIVDAVEEDALFDSIKGLAFRREGGIVLNEPGGRIEDLDSLPLPAFEIFPLDRYKPFYGRGRGRLELPVSTSRGCPFRCVFCAKLGGDRVVFRDVSKVADEIETMIDRHGVRQVFFIDESLTLKPERVSALCGEFVSRGINRKINWVASSRADIERETILQMKEANCSHLILGIESGSPEILKKNRKGITLEQARETISQCREAGITTDGNFILGLPHDTEQTMRTTAKFAASLELTYASFFLLVPYPGTTAYEMAEKGEAGLKLLSKDWDLYCKHMGGAVELRDVPRRKLEMLQVMAYLRFYMRPSRFLTLFRKVEAGRIATYLLFTLKAFFSGKKRAER